MVYLAEPVMIPVRVGPHAYSHEPLPPHWWSAEMLRVFLGRGRYDALVDADVIVEIP